MTYILSVLVLALVGGTVYLTTQTFRSGHLLVVSYYRGHDSIFLERGVDGRYTVIQPAWIPLAVARFTRARTAAALGAVSQGLGQYVPGRGQPLRPLPRAGRRARAVHV
ncbi:MAG TPA: hypothetical protein VHG28_20595 [Longimicrobiaceae bacterium]|nr:hypothetical protein [Longimicrobiaceae bacterium]